MSAPFKAGQTVTICPPAAPIERGYCWMLAFAGLRGTVVKVGYLMASETIDRWTHLQIKRYRQYKNVTVQLDPTATLSNPTDNTAWNFGHDHGRVTFPIAWVEESSPVMIVRRPEPADEAARRCDAATAPNHPAVDAIAADWVAESCPFCGNAGERRAQNTTRSGLVLVICDACNHADVCEHDDIERAQVRAIFNPERATKEAPDPETQATIDRQWASIPALIARESIPDLTTPDISAPVAEDPAIIDLARRVAALPSNFAEPMHTPTLADVDAAIAIGDDAESAAARALAETNDGAIFVANVRAAMQGDDRQRASRQAEWSAAHGAALRIVARPESVGAWGEPLALTIAEDAPADLPDLTDRDLAPLDLCRLIVAQPASYLDETDATRPGMQFLTVNAAVIAFLQEHGNAPAADHAYPQIAIVRLNAAWHAMCRMEGYKAAAMWQTAHASAARALRLLADAERVELALRYGDYEDNARLAASLRHDDTSVADDPNADPYGDDEDAALAALEADQLRAEQNYAASVLGDDAPANPYPLIAIPSGPAVPPAAKLAHLADAIEDTAAAMYDDDETSIGPDTLIVLSDALRVLIGAETTIEPFRRIAANALIASL